MYYYTLEAFSLWVHFFWGFFCFFFFLVVVVNSI